MSPDAGYGVGRWPGLSPQVVFVGGGVLVRVVMQGVWGERVSIRAEVVGRARTPTGEGDAVESSRDRESGAENTGHQLMGWVAVYGRATGVSIVVPSTILFF